MIIRAVSSPHICLRCRLRLAQQRSVPSRAQFAFLSTDTRGLQWSPRVEDRERQDQNGTPSEDATSTVKTRTVYPAIYRPLNSPRPGLSEHPLGRVYGYKGEMIREQNEDLGVAALGEKGKVIVLREFGMHYAKAPDIPEAEAAEKVDILARLDSERGLAGHQEVMDNINELKPKDPQLKDWGAFDALMEQLTEGFTVLQLARYVDAHINKAMPGNSRDVDQQSSSETSLWMPGLSESIDQFNTSVSRGYYKLEQLTKKERLALLLVRGCWSVTIPEVQEGQGEIEISMPQSQLDWLLKGTISPLRSISQRLLSEEKIEASRSRGIVRITSTRARADVIVSEIQRWAGNIKNSSINLKVLVKRRNHASRRKIVKETLGNSEVLSHLSQLVGADIAIDYSDGKQKYRVSYVDDTDAGFSNRVDITKQLLLDSVTVPERSVNKLGCAVVGNSPRGCFVKFEPTSGLNWLGRLREWTRFTSAVPKKIDPEEESQKQASILLPKDKGDPESQQDESKSKIALHFAPMMERKGGKLPADQENQHWARRHFILSSVQLGKYLHSGPGAEAMQMHLAEDSLHAGNMHTFCPAIPNLSRILRSANRLYAEDSQSIVMKFQPSPWAQNRLSKTVGYDGLKTYPPVEMRFSVQPETQEMELKDVVAKLTAHNSDLMMPDQAVDLRFSQETTCRLQYPGRVKAIEEFVAKSCVSNGLPQTPPKLILPIDKHLCDQSAGPELLDPDSPAVDVEYLYTGHEFRTNMLLNYHGWTLIYTSIQAGKAGANRGELRLRPRRTPMHNPSPEIELTEESESESFIETAFELAKLVSDVPGPFNIKKINSPYVRFIHLPPDEIPERRGYKFFAKRVDFTGRPEAEPVEIENQEKEGEQSEVVNNSPPSPPFGWD